MKMTLTLEEYHTRITGDPPEQLSIDFDSDQKFQVIINMKGQKMRILLDDLLRVADTLKASV